MDLSTHFPVSAPPEVPKTLPFNVIPAKAGIQKAFDIKELLNIEFKICMESFLERHIESLTFFWIPAFAGMTNVVEMEVGKHKVLLIKG